MINEIDHYPEQFLDCEPKDLHQLFGKPTLMHLQGERPEPLFISTLLHGNETTGIYALQQLLKKYRNDTLPRSLSIFIGNVEAAAEYQRRLDRQADFNRIWPGTHEDFLAEAHAMKQVTETMREMKTFASIDVHNNTGRNPHYGCINRLDPRYLALAGLFSNTVVYFITPKGVQSAAFAEFCPAVTLESGQSGEAAGISHVFRYLDVCLNLEEIPARAPEHINLYHTVARVTIPEAYSFGFSDDATINLLPEIENYNFTDLEPGTPIAHIEPGNQVCVQSWNEFEQENTRDYFELKNDEIVFKKHVMPSMLTVNTQVIRQDCLCYLMEKISLDEK